ncbi:hypothetical protein B0H11DRAFT_2277810, partial [Mycena galericulata]
MLVPVTLTALNTGKTRTVKALLDNGCTTTCIDRDYAKAEGFELKELDMHIVARNADGTENSRGKITHYVELIMSVGPHHERQRFLVTGLGKARVFIGYNWLFKHNPENLLRTLIDSKAKAAYPECDLRLLLTTAWKFRGDNITPVHLLIQPTRKIKGYNIIL